MAETLRVFVRGLRIEAEIGVHPHERGRRQPLVVDITLELQPVAVSRIGETVNYERLAEAARGLAAEGHIELVETFAQRLAAACLEPDAAQAVTVRVEKPEALAGAAAAGVEVSRRKAE